MKEFSFFHLFGHVPVLATELNRAVIGVIRLDSPALYKTGRMSPSVIPLFVLILAKGE